MSEVLNIEKPKRITFIDLTRAYAIIMMVQGHTIDLVLAKQFRYHSTLYYLWEYNRGVTAPLFLFMSGVIFTYLLIKYQSKEGNPRIKKGFNRGLMLMGIGYLLQFNFSLFFEFPSSLNNPANYAIVVHVLQIIGLGLILLLALYKLSQWTRTPYFIWLLLSGLSLIVFHNYVYNLSWLDKLPVFIENYFTLKYGSHFTIFPFLGYLMLGGALGSTIPHFNKFYTSYKMGISFIAISVFMYFFSHYILHDAHNHWHYYHKNNFLPDFIMFDRIWFVLVIVGIFSLLSLKFQNIHPFILTMGKNTLWIYVFHHFILYYTIFIPGPILTFFAGKLNPWQSVFVAIGVIVIVLVALYYYTKLVKKYHPKYLKLK